MKPKYFIKTYYEHKEGFHHKQPVKKLNGKEYHQYSQDSYERKNWGDIKLKSHKYTEALRICDSNLWLDEKLKENGLKVIYDFLLKQEGSGSCTKLFPFEVFLMNDGFEMVSFCELNAFSPGVTLWLDKNNKPLGLSTNRLYKKIDHLVYLGFGRGKGNGKFYFQTSVDKRFYFEVDNEFTNYDKAINAELEPMQEDMVFPNE
ncbi:hypothetical protein LCGC14_0370930 [marine sediment metagenome]|uniref:Uncharacterized protein n=1 Tax=marine sediment metagenome TaxID=412755 RepID=A0A0F9TNA0_9ZZZZ|nr:hypothetical protein [Maribacter sp.]HDZ04854.1 hypothetical protein [Maribacter sp.]